MWQRLTTKGKADSFLLFPSTECALIVVGVQTPCINGVRYHLHGATAGLTGKPLNP